MERIEVFSKMLGCPQSARNSGDHREDLTECCDATFTF
jgi:hypothetical protein